MNPFLRSRREGEEVERRWMAGHQRRWRGARREFDDNQLVNRLTIKALNAYTRSCKRNVPLFEPPKCCQATWPAHA